MNAHRTPLGVRAMRRVLVVLLLLLALTALAPGAAPTAQAAPVAAAGNGLPDLLPGDLGSCKGEEPFTTPDGAPYATVDTGPATPDPASDPFAPGSTTTVYEQYGFGGLTWVNYDPGCDPVAAGAKSTSLSVAGALFGVLVLGVAVTTAVSRWAFDPATVATLEPLQRVGASAFGEAIFLPLGGIAVALAGLLAMWKFARAGAVSAAASTALWAVIISALAVAAFTSPTVLAPQVDAAATGAVAHVSARVAGDADGNSSYADTLGGNLTRGVLYETWLAGNLGRSAGPTAEQFGPRLLAASTVSRSELAATQDDPKALAALQESKAEEFAAVAEEIKQADPTAYSYLAGNHNGARLGTALLGFLALGATSIYPFLAAIYLLFAFVVVRGAIVVTPLVALIAVFPSQRFRLFAVFQYAATAVVAGVILGIVSSLVVRATGALLSPTTPLPWFLALLMIAVICAAAWHFTKPIRNLKALGKQVTKGLHRPKPYEGPKTIPGDTSRDPSNRSDWSEPYNPEAREPQTYRHSTPAESRMRTYGRAALTGAVQGAAASVAAGVVTGGTATAGAAAAGAAKGAGTAAASAAITSTSTTAATSSTGAPAAALPPPYTPPTASDAPGATKSAPSSSYRPGDPKQATQGADGVWEITDLYSPPNTGADADSTAGATR